MEGVRRVVPASLSPSADAQWLERMTVVPAPFPVLPVPDQHPGVEMPPALAGEVWGERGGAGWGGGVPLEMGKRVGRSGCILGTWARSNVEFDSFKGGKCKLPSHLKGACLRRVVPAAGRGTCGAPAGGCRGPPVAGSGAGGPVPGEQEPLGFSGPVAGAAGLTLCQGKQWSLPSGSSCQLQRQLKNAVCLGFLPG